jgi:hypothetical protein
MKKLFMIALALFFVTATSSIVLADGTSTTAAAPAKTAPKSHKKKSHKKKAAATTAPATTAPAAK